MLCCVYTGGWCTPRCGTWSEVLKYNPDTDQWEKVGDMDTRAEGIRLFLDFHRFASFNQCTYACRFRKSLNGIFSFTQKSEKPLQKVSNLL